MEDPRLRCFSPPVSSSESSKSSLSSRTTRVSRRENLIAIHGERCAFCGSESSITVAHLVSSRHTEEVSTYFGFPPYRSAMELNSLRNYILLCGTLGVEGTCHHEFDRNLIAVTQNSLGDGYVMICLNKTFAKYSEVHMKPPRFNLEQPPYRRILAWRTIKCVSEYPSLLTDTDLTFLLNSAELSDKVR